MTDRLKTGDEVYWRVKGRPDAQFKYGVVTVLPGGGRVAMGRFKGDKEPRALRLVGIEWRPYTGRRR